MKQINFIFIGIILLSSCAINQKIDYRSFHVNAKEIKENSIDLAFLDHRDVVVTGKKQPTFVGYMRSATGIPWSINTKGNSEFIDDLANGMIKSFTLQNIKATKIQTKWEDSEDSVKSSLFLLSGNKKIFFVIHEFHTDGYGKQTLLYNINLFIYNKVGMLLRNKSIKGETKLGGSAILGAGDYKNYAPALVSDFFNKIINDPEILTAINSN